MGYKKVPVIHTLTDIPGEDGLIVRLKSISFGKVRRLIRLSDSEDESSMDEISEQFVQALVSWNLEDENDQPVPTTLEGVEDQDFDFIMKIVSAWLDRLTGPSEELGKGSQPGAQFPGQPLTMELL